VSPPGLLRQSTSIPGLVCQRAARDHLSVATDVLFALRTMRAYGLLSMVAWASDKNVPHRSVPRHRPKEPCSKLRPDQASIMYCTASRA
jgi:hypothetical protein